LGLKAHVGEWDDADSVRRAVEELELDEVQHGIATAQPRSVMRFLADNRIHLNLCPTSNVLLGRVESLARDPIRKLYDGVGRLVWCTAPEENLHDEAVDNYALTVATYSPLAITRDLCRAICCFRIGR
jgi:hypothetical protein